jgi:integrase
MNDNLGLGAYTAAHRTRQRGLEDGYVDKTGKREKKWRGWYHVYVKKDDGTETRIKRKRIIGPVVGMTKAEAEEEHRIWIRRFHTLPAAETPAATVATLCDDLFQLREGDWEDAARSCNASVFGLIKAGLGTRQIEQVNADDLKQFINGLPKRTWNTPKGRNKTGISVSYVKKAITQLRAIFDLAEERDLIHKNPARSINIRLSVPKQARRPDKTVFPPRDLLPLLGALEERDKIIVWLSMLGATRPGELFAVYGRDVGPDWVYIEKSLDRKRQLKSTKTERPRYIHVPPVIAEELQRFMLEERVGPNDLVFRNTKGGPLDRKNFLDRVLRPAAKRAKITTLDVDFQMLRRSFATLAQVVGLDVKAIQSQLGHSRPDMTLLEYVQPLDPLTREKMARLEGMIRGTIEMPRDVTAKLGSKMVN